MLGICQSLRSRRYRLARHRLPWALVVVAMATFASACQDQEVLTTTKNLLRPGPMGMACVGRAGDAGVQTGYPLDRCKAVASGVDAGVRGSLFGLVANTGRGDVAFFRTSGSGEALIDLDRTSPGFGFVPVGALPMDLTTTSDGCRAYTANAGSCDLSVIDVPGVIRLAAAELESAAGALVSRVIPHTSEGPLGAKPESIVIVPASVRAKDDGQTCRVQPGYRAYVTFPTCGLVAEIDLRDGMVVRGLLITKDGFQETTTPRCPLECAATPKTPGKEGAKDGGGSDIGTPDATPVDAAADAAKPDAASVDAGVDALAGDSGAAVDAKVADAIATGDAKPTDATGGDAGGDAGLPLVSAAGVLPTALALTPSGDKLFISSAGATFITAVDVAADGAFSNIRRITLAGVRAQTLRLAISPPTATVGQFLYAIARDNSVRVVSLELEQECETNVDLLPLPKLVDITRARCFPVGDPNTPARRVVAKGPGLTFSSRLPMDVSFVKVARDPADEVKPLAERLATPLVGVFALVATSDGNVFVVDIEDENRLEAGTTEVPRTHLPHHIRNVLQGTEDSQTYEDQDTPYEVTTILGAGSGGVPVVVNKVGEDLAGVRLRAVGELVALNWSANYEPRLVARFSGQLKVDKSQLVLADRGADYCRASVLGRQEVDGRALRHGDIIDFVGCDTDQDCGLNQTCNRVVGQESAYGLCFEKGREEALFAQCGAYLRGKREFLVRRAFRDELYLDALPLEPQKVLLQASQPAGGCTRNEDCQPSYLCALEDRVVPGGKDPLTKGQCFRPGCTKDADCGSGHCVQPLDGSPKICAAAPIPVEQGGQCSADADCRPPQTGASCLSDRDCDRRAECRLVDSSSSNKTCVDRQYVCSTLPGLRNRCVRPTPCFAELQRYDVRAGRSFTLGTYHRVIADAQSNECVEDATRDPLFQNRIPIGLPVYPVVLGPRCESSPVFPAAPKPNPCFELLDQPYEGFLARGSAEGERTLVWGPRGTGTEKQGPITVVHYANPDIQLMLGVGHLARIPETIAGDATYAPMPERGLSMDAEVQSGYSRLATPGSGSIALPYRVLAGPDNRIYLVDMGDRSDTGATTRGQVLRWFAKDLTLETFLVK